VDDTGGLGGRVDELVDDGDNGDDTWRTTSLTAIVNVI